MGRLLGVAGLTVALTGCVMVTERPADSSPPPAPPSSESSASATPIPEESPTAQAEREAFVPEQSSPSAGSPPAP